MFRPQERIPPQASPGPQTLRPISDLRVSHGDVLLATDPATRCLHAPAWSIGRLYVTPAMRPIIYFAIAMEYAALTEFAGWLPLPEVDLGT